VNSLMVLLERTIPALDAEANELCAALRAVLVARLSGSPAAARIFAIELVAREAVQNAVDYGCSRDGTRQIRFSSQMENGTLRLVVSDEGPGFDPLAVLSRELKTEPGTSGNGIRIISAYTDHYEYRDGGRTLVADFVLGEESLMQDLPSSGSWTPGADLVAANVQKAKEELRALVAASSGDFLVDLTSVAMIDSKGLGILIAAINSLEAVGRTMRVIGANGDLVELFRMMRLDRHMRIG
jgi:anti-anti-sigma factor